MVSHAHYDHSGGVAALQRLTGATVYTSVEAAKALRSGKLQNDDPQYGYGPENTSFPAINNVAVLADREWSWESCALGSCYDIVYADSLTAVSAKGYRFSAGPAANQITESAGAIAELDCDILLSPHPFFFGMQDKLLKRDGGNPFVNNVACMIYAESALDWLEQRLDSE